MGFGLKRKIKRTVKKVDSKLLGGIIARKYQGIKKTHGEQIYNMRSKYHRRFGSFGKKYKVLRNTEIPVRDLYLAQYFRNDFTNYMHVDGAVRYLAIENYYGKDNNGFDLYRKMQAPSGFDWTQRYEKLINSYEKNGFKDDNVLELDEHFAVMDGSHRLTLALYAQQEFIKAKIFKCERNRNFDYDWFWKNDFSSQECHIIKAKSQEMFEKCNYDFVGVLWSPAQKYFDEIIEDLKMFEPDEISLIEYKDFELQEEDFLHLFRALYHEDILNEEGMNYKIQEIKSCMPKGYKSFPLRAFKLRIKNPKIGLNEKNGSFQSQEIKRIKSVFRTRYKGKIEDYKYDVIMHIADNYMQSKFCNKVIGIGESIQNLNNELEKINCKINLPKSKSDLNSFYMTQINEIVCNNHVDNNVIKNIIEILNNYFNDSWIKIDKEKNESRVINIMIRDFRLYRIRVIDLNSVDK